MKDRRKLIAGILLSILLTLYALHSTQFLFKWIPVEPLNGYFLRAKIDRFTWSGWFSGSFQESGEKFLNEKFGFRSFFIRMNHQFRFSLFNKVKTAWVIVGKENYLYEHNYIKAFYGDDFIGHDSIENRMYKFKLLQDTFNDRGKTLMIVFAPGKGAFFPEYIPDEFHKEKGITNLDVYRQYAEKYQIHHIDFHKYFIDNKEKTPYPLYPQYGIHWSHYGACLVMDSIVRYIEKLNNIEIPHIYWDKINMAKAHKEDNDISKAMNLLFPPRTYEMAYPKYQFESDEGKTKPSLLVIADSFYGSMSNEGLDSMFSNTHWWYYNCEIYPESRVAWLTTNEINYFDEVLSYDIIILLSSDINLPNFGWGFIENSYQYFYP